MKPPGEMLALHWQQAYDPNIAWENVMWQRFHRTVSVIPTANQRQLVPTENDLARFEREHNFQLPSPYRSYICGIGPGELAGYFVIGAPLYDRPDKGMQRYASLADSTLMLEIYGDERVLRMKAFGSSVGGDIFAWDPEMRCPGRLLDYPVFILPRDWNRIVKVALTFKSFVYDVCLGKGLMAALPYVESEGEVERTFRPLTLRARPKKRTRAKKAASKKPRQR